MYLATILSPLGPLTALAEEEALVGLWMEGQAHFGRGWNLEQARPEYNPVLHQLEEWLAQYFAGETMPFPGLLRPKGTAFQQRVWEMLLQIPAGESSTYGQLAAALGSSPRAVGGAVGRNPISIVIPCHRVLAADGRLGGYAGGLERKRLLLDLEHIPYRI